MKSIRDRGWRGLRYRIISLWLRTKYRVKLPFIFLRNVWTFRKHLWNHRRWHGPLSVTTFTHQILIDLEVALSKEHDRIPHDVGTANSLIGVRKALNLFKRLDENLYSEEAARSMGISKSQWRVISDTLYKNLQTGPRTPEEREAHQQFFTTMHLSEQLYERDWAELWNHLRGFEGMDFDEESQWHLPPVGSDMRKWYIW